MRKHIRLQILPQAMEMEKTNKDWITERGWYAAFLFLFRSPERNENLVGISPRGDLYEIKGYHLPWRLERC